MRGLDRTVMVELATRQHGVMTRRQLLDAGIHEDVIDRALWRDELLRVHPGVYRVGHRAPSIESTYLAAVLACGDGALLGGLAAAHLLGLVRSAPAEPLVLAPTERRIERVRVRRCRSLSVDDRSVFRGVPMTTLSRTLVDLAATLDEDALARTCHEAIVRHRLSPPAVVALLERMPNARGARALRRVLVGDIPVTLSALERRFLKLLDADGLPRPETNCRAGSKRVDCRWPEHRLTVELDSYRYHQSRHAWEQDRVRDREARARGDRMRRYTYRDVYEHPRPMLDELTTLLADRPA
jgi:very-short-patch-repair endonuclease